MQCIYSVVHIRTKYWDKQKDEEEQVAISRIYIKNNIPFLCGRMVAVIKKSMDRIPVEACTNDDNFVVTYIRQ